MPSPVGLPFHACVRSEDSNPHARKPRAWAACVSQLRHERVEWMTGFEPATSAMATPRSPELSYIHLEPFPGVEPGGLSLPRTRARRREGRRASDWPRTSCLPLTRRTLFPVSYRGTAAGQGFEPRLTGSGPAVLPVRRSGTVRVRRQGLEPRFAGLRVQCITSYACGASRAWTTGDSNPAPPACDTGALPTMS